MLFPQSFIDRVNALIDQRKDDLEKIRVRFDRRTVWTGIPDHWLDETVDLGLGFGEYRVELLDEGGTAIRSAQITIKEPPANGIPTAHDEAGQELHAEVVQERGRQSARAPAAEAAAASNINGQLAKALTDMARTVQRQSEGVLNACLDRLENVENRLDRTYRLLYQVVSDGGAMQAEVAVHEALAEVSEEEMGSEVVAIRALESFDRLVAVAERKWDKKQSEKATNTEDKPPCPEI